MAKCDQNSTTLCAFLVLVFFPLSSPISPFPSPLFRFFFFFSERSSFPRASRSTAPSSPFSHSRSDAAGAPSASDEVFAHLAVALGLDLRFFRMAEPPLMFHNYSKFDASAIRAVANEAWGALFPDEPPPPLSPYGDEDDDVEVVSEVVA